MASHAIEPADLQDTPGGPVVLEGSNAPNQSPTSAPTAPTAPTAPAQGGVPKGASLETPADVPNGQGVQVSQQPVEESSEGKPEGNMNLIDQVGAGVDTLQGGLVSIIGSFATEGSPGWNYSQRYHAQQQKLAQEVPIESMNSFSEILEDPLKAVRVGIQTTARSLPTVAVAAVPYAGLGVVAASSSGDVYANQEDDRKNLALAYSSGISQAVLEKVGARATGILPGSATSQVTGGIIKRGTKKIVKGAVGESVTEAGQHVINNVGVNQTFEGATDGVEGAAVTGFLGGTTMTVAGSGVKKSYKAITGATAVNPNLDLNNLPPNVQSTLTASHDNAARQDAIEAELEGEGLTVARRDVLLAERNELNDNVGVGSFLDAVAGINELGGALGPQALDVEVRSGLSTGSPVVSKGFEILGFSQGEVNRSGVTSQVSKAGFSSHLGLGKTGVLSSAGARLSATREAGRAFLRDLAGSFNDQTFNVTNKIADLKKMRSVAGSTAERTTISARITELETATQYLGEIKQAMSAQRSDRADLQGEISARAQEVSDLLVKNGMSRNFNAVRLVKTYLTANDILLKQDPSFYNGTVDRFADVGRLGANAFVSSTGVGSFIDSASIVSRLHNNKARKALRERLAQSRQIIPEQVAPSAAPVDAPIDTPPTTPPNTPPQNGPVDAPVDGPVDAPVDAPAVIPNDTFVDAPSEAPASNTVAPANVDPVTPPTPTAPTVNTSLGMQEDVVGSGQNAQEAIVAEEQATQAELARQSDEQVTARMEELDSLRQAIPDEVQSLTESRDAAQAVQEETAEGVAAQEENVGLLNTRIDELQGDLAEIQSETITLNEEASSRGLNTRASEIYSGMMTQVSNRVVHQLEQETQESLSQEDKTAVEDTVKGVVGELNETALVDLSAKELSEVSQAVSEEVIQRLVPGEDSAGMISNMREDAVVEEAAPEVVEEAVVEEAPRVNESAPMVRDVVSEGQTAQADQLSRVVEQPIVEEAVVEEAPRVNETAPLVRDVVSEGQAAKAEQEVVVPDAQVALEATVQQSIDEVASGGQIDDALISQNADDAVALTRELVQNYPSNGKEEDVLVPTFDETLSKELDIQGTRALRDAHNAFDLYADQTNAQNIPAYAEIRKSMTKGNDLAAAKSDLKEAKRIADRVTSVEVQAFNELLRRGADSDAQVAAESKGAHAGVQWLRLKQVADKEGVTDTVLEDIYSRYPDKQELSPSAYASLVKEMQTANKAKLKEEAKASDKEKAVKAKEREKDQKDPEREAPVVDKEAENKAKAKAQWEHLARIAKENQLDNTTLKSIAQRYPNEDLLTTSQLASLVRELQKASQVSNKPAALTAAEKAAGVKQSKVEAEAEKSRKIEEEYTNQISLIKTLARKLGITAKARDQILDDTYGPIPTPLTAAQFRSFWRTLRSHPETRTNKARSKKEQATHKEMLKASDKQVDVLAKKVSSLTDQITELQDSNAAEVAPVQSNVTNNQSSVTNNDSRSYNSNQSSTTNNTDARSVTNNTDARSVTNNNETNNSNFNYVNIVNQMSDNTVSEAILSMKNQLGEANDALISRIEKIAKEMSKRGSSPSNTTSAEALQRAASVIKTVKADIAKRRRNVRNKRVIQGANGLLFREDISKIQAVIGQSHTSYMGPIGANLKGNAFGIYNPAGQIMWNSEAAFLEGIAQETSLGRASQDVRVEPEVTQDIIDDTDSTPPTPPKGPSKPAPTSTPTDDTVSAFKSILADIDSATASASPKANAKVEVEVATPKTSTTAPKKATSALSAASKPNTPKKAAPKKAATKGKTAKQKLDEELGYKEDAPIVIAERSPTIEKALNSYNGKPETFGAFSKEFGNTLAASNESLGSILNDAKPADRDRIKALAVIKALKIKGDKMPTRKELTERYDQYMTDKTARVVKEVKEASEKRQAEVVSQLNEFIANNPTQEAPKAQDDKVEVEVNDDGEVANTSEYDEIQAKEDRLGALRAATKVVKGQDPAKAEKKRRILQKSLDKIEEEGTKSDYEVVASNGGKDIYAVFENGSDKLVQILKNRPGAKIIALSLALAAGGASAGEDYEDINFATSKGRSQFVLTSSVFKTDEERAAFMAQIYYESKGVPKSELTSYSEKALIANFGKHRMGGYTPKQLARKPKLAANVLYGGKFGKDNLGNTEKGDGYKYRGRGLIQITGRYNYKKFGKIVGVDLVNHPERANEPDIAKALAIAFWKSEVQTQVKDFSDTTAVTKEVNGGDHGLARRKELYLAYKKSADDYKKTKPAKPLADSDIRTIAEKTDPISISEKYSGVKVDVIDSILGKAMDLVK